MAVAAATPRSIVVDDGECRRRLVTADPPCLLVTLDIVTSNEGLVACTNLLAPTTIVLFVVFLCLYSSLIFILHPSSITTSYRNPEVRLECEFARGPAETCDIINLFDRR